MYGYDLNKGNGSGEEEMKPGDLWVTYLAADKYLVEELKDDLMLGSMHRLNKFNVCLLFEQFLMIPLDEVKEFVCKEMEMILDELKKYIQAFSEDAFGSEYFTQIEEETLVHLLRLEFLNLPESDVLKACLRWTEAEIERQGLVSTIENRQKVFSKIKSFVRFTDLDFDQLSELSGLREVLTHDELASLHLKWTGKCNQIAIECRTERQKSRKIYEVNCGPLAYFNRNKSLSEFSIKLISDRKVCITSIQTNQSYISNLELKVFNWEQNERVPLAFLEFKRYLTDEGWCFEPRRALEIDSRVKYELFFSFSKKEFYSIYKNKSFGTNSFGFEFSEFGEAHCIKSFKFCEVSNYGNAKSK